jgi:hypothetical protein
MTTDRLHSDEAARLIEKAAWVWSSAPENTKTKDHTICLAKFQAFGTVAADVLQICAAPFGFELAIREALVKFPRPRWTTAPADQAEWMRQNWLANVRADVISTLARG